MSERKITVYINLEGKDRLVGTLWSNFVRGKETSSFEYSSEWLSDKKCFSMEPGLYLGPGKQVPSRQIPLFGSFGDSSPDNWGRLLMRRYENQQAKAEGRKPKTLNEIDYLLRVDDISRQGALRFKLDDKQDFEYPSSIQSVPPILSITKLLWASQNILDKNESENDLKLLLAPGSSLGGARPKASVIDSNNDLCIAKFPKRDDPIDSVLWEGVACKLADLCGLRVQKWSILTANTKHILILKRFDRKKNIRIPFLSAMSMLNAVDNDSYIHSYLDIADVIRQYGGDVKGDLIELWRRVVFSILISNTDDHLRNHGFLYDNKKGWRLSPLYDVNPSFDNKNTLTTYITATDNTQNEELVLEVCEYFGLSLKEASKTIIEMKRIVARWTQVAKELGIKKTEISRMEIAFRV